MRVCYLSKQHFKDTGIIARVYPTDDASFSIEVRPGCVDVIGSSFLSPALARTFANGIIEAARIAEVGYVDQDHVNSGKAQPEMPRVQVHDL